MVGKVTDCHDWPKMTAASSQLIRQSCAVVLFSFPANGIDISGNFDILGFMDLLDIFKALSNRTRLEILKRLKDPENAFPPQDEGDVHTVGVCVSSIQEGIGLSQSTVSDYLATLQRAGLIDVQRIGQWTYYKRNEEAIRKFSELIGKDL